MTQNNMEVITRRSIGSYERCIPEKVSGGSKAQMECFVADAKADIAHLSSSLTSAQAEIAVQKQANEALMRERANMVATHREQMERLTKERDEGRRGEHTYSEHEPTWSELVAAWKDHAEAAEKERDALRGALDAAAEEFALIEMRLRDKQPERALGAAMCGQKDARAALHKGHDQPSS